MSNKKHQVGIDLLNSIDAIKHMLIENRNISEPSFQNRPKSHKDPVPNDPYWTPFNCYLFAQNRLYREWPNGEFVIKEDPKAAAYYAINVLDGPWPDSEIGRYAEDKISTDPNLALHYAKLVKGKWPLIERVMASRPDWAYEYAKSALEHQWDGPYAQAAEAVISNDPYIATLYCMDLKHPKRYDNPQTERRILDSIYGSLYARTVAPELTIKELNDEVNYRLEVLHTGQDIDFTNVVEESKWDPNLKHPVPDVRTSSARVLVHYAIDHLKRRWPEAEPYILKNIGIEHNDRDYLYYYALLVIRPYDKENPDYDRGRWLEAEPFIVVDPHLAYGYARDILMERWKSPEVELGIIYSGSAKYYAEYVAETSEDELREDIENKLNDLHYHDSIDLKDTIEEAVDNLLPLITESRREDEKRAMALFHIALDKKNAREEGLTPKQESEILKSPEYAYKYAQYVIEGEWVEAEPIILTDQYWAFNYAKNVIKGTWKAAEPLILGGKDLRFALSYATDISKIRLAPMVELRIIEHFEDDDVDDYGYYLYAYCTEVAKMSVEDLKADAEMKISELTSGDDLDLSNTVEESIDRLLPLISENEKKPKPDPSKMTQYEIYRYMNKGKNRGKRWPEAESYIMKDPRFAYYYTCYAINKGLYLGIRWPEAEPYIIKSPEYAVNYTRDVINKNKSLGIRWPKAEQYIMKSPENARNYTHYVINKGFYLGIRWPEAEPYIMKDPKSACYYAESILNKEEDLGIRWPEAEPYIIRDKRWAERYARYSAQMPYERFLAEVKAVQRDLHPQEDKDFTDIYDESIDRLMLLINEGLLPDPKKLTPQECYNYAYNFILKMDQDGKCEQWLSDAEEIIKHDPEYASAYAKNVLNHEPIRKADRKKRFISAEEYIMKSPKWAYIYARDIYSKSGQRDKLRWEDAEPFILQDPKYAYFYAQYVAHMPLEVIQADVDKKMGQMFPDENKDLSDTTEEAIDRLMPLITENAEELPDFERMSPINAFNYVYFRSLDKDNVNKMRCPEAERTIIKDPHVASLYAQFVLGERWYLAEPLIIKDLGRAKVYADKLVKMPFKDFLDEVKSTSQFLIKNDETDLSGTAEEAIDRLMPLIAENKVDPEDYDINRRDALECYTTARFVIKKRWPKAEPKILTHPYASYLYANYVLDRPWKQAEPIISTDAKSSLYYAQYVLKRRWPEGEMAIKQDPEYAYDYAEDVIKPFDKNNPNYNNGRWDDPTTELKILNAPWEMPYAERIAEMSREDLLAEIELKMKDIVPHDDINLTDTTDEAIDRLMPLIYEASRKDYWGRRKEFKEYYPISNWLDKAINIIRSKFLGSHTPKFQQSIIALKAKADEYRKKGADNFKIGADLFSYKEPYPPKEVLDDRTMPSSIKSLLIGAFHDEEKKLNKEYENSLKDTWEHEWPAPEHKKQENIQYDLRRRLRGEAIAAREHLKKFKDTTADDDLNLSDIDEE